MKQKIFTNTLHELILQSDIRQTVIADVLGITSAAVSQFVHGAALPKSIQLAEILSLLNIIDGRRVLLQQMLFKAREEAILNGKLIEINTEDKFSPEDGDELDDTKYWMGYSNIQPQVNQPQAAAESPAAQEQQTEKFIGETINSDDDDSDDDIDDFDYISIFGYGIGDDGMDNDGTDADSNGGKNIESDKENNGENNTEGEGESNAEGDGESDAEGDGEKNDEDDNSINLDEIYKETYGSNIFFSQPASGVPVIKLDDLRNFDKGMNLEDFAFNCSHDIVIRDYGSMCGFPIVVQATGDMLGLRYFGIVQLVVTDKTPTRKTLFELKYYKRNDYFRLLPLDDGSNLLHGLESLFDPSNFPRIKSTWMMYVLELTVFPFSAEALAMNRGELL